LNRAIVQDGNMTRTKWEGEAPAEPLRGPRAAPEPHYAREHPTHGVLLSSRRPTIVFLTVCTKDRTPWVADSAVHERLRAAWIDATAWLVGRYVLMPDHVHLFCAPSAQGSAGASPSHSDTGLTPLDNWVRYWKSQFAKRGQNPQHRWQADHWDTRLRHEESYNAKWDYVRHNPVRAGLVARPEDWPYTGEIHALRW
jgi:putative transposase